MMSNPFIEEAYKMGENVLDGPRHLHLKRIGSVPETYAPVRIDTKPRYSEREGT